VLIGSFNPDDGDLHKGLLDRIGLIASEPHGLSSDERTELLRRRAQFDSNPESFVREHQDQTIRLRDSIEDARRRLTTIVSAMKTVTPEFRGAKFWNRRQSRGNIRCARITSQRRI